MDKAKEQAEAWVGDAILLLYARQKILRDDGIVDGPKCTRMTSNQFLACFGEPTSVEARLGRVYLEHGLERAFEWIGETLMPLFEKHELKRMRGRKQ